jgi:deferrochelatase/peroxidase EfeB
LSVNSRHLHSGNLSVLIGYNSNIFSINGAKRILPIDLSQARIESPRPSGGGMVIDGCTLTYDKDVTCNHISSDHIVLQFVADNEFSTSRAVVETWKKLKNIKIDNGGEVPLFISKIYTGFRTVDYRNWLGFHDGVSNIRTDKRAKIIAIANSQVQSEDRWTVNGTYLAFLRINIDLDSWYDVMPRNLEIIIGRDKVTGCPLIGVDKKGNPVKNSSCPIRGTFEIIEKGNEFFREHPPYGHQRNVPADINDESLKSSHIGSALNIDPMHPLKTDSSLIFRQGFHFFETMEKSPGFTVGLNFISFQNTTERILKSLAYAFGRREIIVKGNSLPSLEKFLSVRAAGIFFVPPRNKLFPGSSIFFEPNGRT